MWFVVILTCFVFILISCSRIYFVREQTKENVSKLNIGMSKQDVIPIVGTDTIKIGYYDYPTPYRIKELKDSSGNDYDVWFYYTDVKYQDGDVTDDELTPVIFRQDTIVAIGWNHLQESK